MASFPSMKGRFDFFVFRLTENECSDEDEINITGSGILIEFAKRIDRKVLYIHRSVQRNLDLKGEKLKDKQKS